MSRVAGYQMFLTVLLLISIWATPWLPFWGSIATFIPGVMTLMVLVVLFTVWFIGSDRPPAWWNRLWEDWIDQD